jgi:hypothetical protein
MQQPGSQQPLNMATTNLEISVSCRDLKDKDAFSKSDPLCVMFYQVCLILIKTFTIHKFSTEPAI